MQVLGKEESWRKILKASWKLIKYIAIHKWYVGLELAREGMFWRALTHDISKLYPSEFFPCACYYYISHRKYMSAYRSAKLLHMHRNPHHVVYWSYSNGNKYNVPMPVSYVREMVADWVGTGRHKKKTCDDVVKKYREVSEQWDVHRLTERRVWKHLKKQISERWAQL